MDKGLTTIDSLLDTLHREISPESQFILEVKRKFRNSSTVQLIRSLGYEICVFPGNEYISTQFITVPSSSLKKVVSIVKKVNKDEKRN